VRRTRAPCDSNPLPFTLTSREKGPLNQGKNRRTIIIKVENSQSSSPSGRKRFARAHRGEALVSPARPVAVPIAFPPAAKLERARARQKLWIGRRRAGDRTAHTHREAGRQAGRQGCGFFFLTVNQQGRRAADGRLVVFPYGLRRARRAGRYCASFVAPSVGCVCDEYIQYVHA
jgi:hypothetical protein